MQSFTSTFILTPSSTSNHYPVLHEVPEFLAKDAHRERRAHSKSNNGCAACKRRRVKCNEAFPCSNCVQRKEHCSRARNHIHDRVSKRSSQNSVIQQPRTPVLQHLLPTNARLTLTNVKLFHHFQTYTRSTLLLPGPVWHLITHLSFSFPFLLHAILCISARHLSYLCRERTSHYAGVASTHLTYALSGFRSSLSVESSKANIDVFMATALLLQFELWANVRHLSGKEEDAGEDGGIYDPGTDALFTYSASLKNILLGCFEPSDVHRSSVMQWLVNDGTLSDAVPVDAATAAQMRDLFLCERKVVPEDLSLVASTYADDPITSKQSDHQSTADNSPYTAVIAALTPLLHLTQISHRIYSSSQLTSSATSISTRIARHILCFPILSRGLFGGKIAARDPRAMLMLYHFFRAVRVLLAGDEFWWAARRAVALEQGLGTLLGDGDEG
ncbi:uncharacterized protein CC84DRAFT_739156 [Paraphaeosphaeria sporulosa]|uniref:Zn(2)-C6 fungal-type domain-containing protein n=1 Tax=Paraphaeosphaeria sporulosa TaxID=1460663 RepID=A0A177CE13_9PLEO|nr:uncharacterized protein CC84DRAFT_739156 [Paraphaeosphaeria sporulosa]OAG05865.1 hypothetical protein CC84DRAFT_739156 [Paraphaeosphaeria sporulosa]